LAIGSLSTSTPSQSKIASKAGPYVACLPRLTGRWPDGPEGECHRKVPSDSDVGTSYISTEAFPLRPLRGHLPRKTGEAIGYSGAEHA
jgi:hypothetical protein